MKSNSFLFAAAVTAMFTACSNDNSPVDDGQLRLSTANTIINTRAADQSLQLTQFADKEKVGIFLVESVSGTATTGGNATTYDQPLEYTADGKGGLTNVQYWPTSGNGLYIYGVYPSAAATAAAAYNATGVEFTVESDQSTDAKYKASDLMTGAPESNPVARTADAVKLTFTHLLTKVNINLTAGVGFETSDLSDAEVSILNTLPTTTFSVQSTTVGAASGTAGDIKVCTGKTGSAVIVPQKVEANTGFIKVEVGGGSYIYKLEKETTFAGQTEYTYEITVSKTKLEVESSIKAWTSGGDTTSGTATLDSTPYLTFKAASEQTFTMKKSGSPSVGTFEYSVGEGDTWTAYTLGNSITFGGTNGDLKLRGKSSVGTATGNSSGYCQISFDNTGVDVAASGDIRTLVDYTDHENVSTSSARFCHLFYDCTVLTSAPALPATTLASNCYYGMFWGCKKLTVAPKLPATTLANYCYNSMFCDCTNLTSAPELPATTLAYYCYQNMFNGCTGLTEAPELPATELAFSCYDNMFRSCEKLTSAPELPATTLAGYCYQYMFYGCTGLAKAPELPATTLVDYCYQKMFQNCTSLNKVTIKAKTSATGALSNWLDGVASSGTIHKYDALSLDAGESGIPSGWTTSSLTE